MGIVFFTFAAAMLGMSCHAQAVDNQANPSGQTTARFVNSLGMKMIFVQARPFEAWTHNLGDSEWASYNIPGNLERPPVGRKSNLKDDFYLAEFTVTNAMYRQFVTEAGHRTPGGEHMDMDGIKRHIDTWQNADFKGDNLPVAGINYHDAVAFCQWLSKKEGRKYRLPEVDEWEYACRAGTDTLYW